MGEPFNFVGLFPSAAWLTILVRSGTSTDPEDGTEIPNADSVVLPSFLPLPGSSKGRKELNGRRNVGEETMVG